ncbi:NXPE family member 3-like [Cheilinus undulatus]|uniref:NXPE family member 3-like n=1 Tax=Cheilinus undulatus TaxID=241271 RepID=UPI001BD3046A|nr:NXPE family member 3-like [Cheilinus undulatus]
MLNGPAHKQCQSKAGPTFKRATLTWKRFSSFDQSDGAKAHQFNHSSAIRQCLSGKKVHLYGDSTIRQWFEFLDALLSGNAQELIRDSPKKTGPYMIWGEKFIYVPTSLLRFIANELDELLGGPNTVLVIGIWAHFDPFPIELYIRRLQSIRRAVVHLLNRAPGTLVVIKTANLREVTVDLALSYSDWYTFQQDKVLRAVFRGLKVQMVDAWEMTLANHLSHNIHPQCPIVKNMINILLSYICPQ